MNYTKSIRVKKYICIFLFVLCIVSLVLGAFIDSILSKISQKYKEYSEESIKEKVKSLKIEDSQQMLQVVKLYLGHFRNNYTTLIVKLTMMVLAITFFLGAILTYSSARIDYLRYIILNRD